MSYLLPCIVLFKCSSIRIAAATVVNLAYGHEILANDDKYIKLATEALGGVLGTGVTGLTTVDLLPICKLSSRKEIL